MASDRRSGAEGSESAEEPGRSSAQAYFEAVEELFIELRGAPMLLSPSDWAVIREWQRRSIPLALVQHTLRELMAPHRERGPGPARIVTLRYARRAVEAAWERSRELGSSAGHSAGIVQEESSPVARLSALADHLPGTLEGVETWRERIRALGSAESDDRPSPSAQTIEAELARLDRELLAAVRRGLAQPERRAIEREVERAVARLGERLDPEQRASTSEKLFDAALRRRNRLPVLSLFDPASLGGSEIDEG